MLQYLEESVDVTNAHKELQDTLRKVFKRKVVKNIGHPGGTEYRATLLTDGKYWFWSRHHRAVHTPRRLNWFGVLGKENDGVSITVEVNTPYKNRNDQASGFFARDSDTGAIYLLHSGRVGGGATGVGKKHFLAWARCEGWLEAEALDSRGKLRTGLIVMPISGVGAARSAVRYIELVRRFKIVAKAGGLHGASFRNQLKRYNDYYAEGRGRRKGVRKSNIDYISRHGEIVDALFDWRKFRPTPYRSRIVKDVLLDLGVLVGGELREVFEVKTSAHRQAVYGALGQLLVHGSAKNCRRVIVLPKGEPIKKDIALAFERLKIKVLRFSLKKDSVVILDD